ncbi:hypothetical protein JRK39_003543 [Vibrio cholerae]|nr:hypothetical protein [Vibrio cholerae]EKF9419652.1 hypothetical protein [Vibrio cholerae]
MKFRVFSDKMFFGFVGMILGFFVGFVILSMFLVTGFTVDIALITNITIAIATIFATYIHYDSTLRQRKQRVWDINKGILLELLESLALVIAESKAALEEEIESQDPSYRSSRTSNPSVYKLFGEKQRYALDVYSALMDDELIKALELAKSNEERINKAVFEDETTDTQEAYEESINSYETLQSKLKDFVSEVSGVRNT